MMMQQDKASDFVIATGETHSVREFVEKSFKHIGVTIKWEGKGVDEIGKDAVTGKVVVKVGPRYFRPTEVEHLLGNPAKAKKELGWKLDVSFDQLVKEMVEEDVKLVESGKLND